MDYYDLLSGVRLNYDSQFVPYFAFEHWLSLGDVVKLSIDTELYHQIYGGVVSSKQVESIISSSYESLSDFSGLVHYLGDYSFSNVPLNQITRGERFLGTGRVLNVEYDSEFNIAIARNVLIAGAWLVFGSNSLSFQ